MTTTFNISPEFIFYTDTGQPLVLTSPVFHQFLEGLFRDSGTESSLAQQNALESINTQSQTKKIFGELIKLQHAVQDLALQVSAKDRQIRDMESRLQEAMFERRERRPDIGGYIVAGVL